jgi:hypothetical protein
MKVARDKLKEVLAAKSEIRKLVVAYQFKGGETKAIHTLANNAEAIAFVTEALGLNEELLKAIRFRP